MIQLYTLPYCPYCINALKRLDNMNIKYKNIPVQDHEKEKYKNSHGMKSFPQIFIQLEKDNYIKLGGYDDLELSIKICNLLKKSNMDNDSLYLMLDHIKDSCAIDEDQQFQRNFY